MAWRTCERSRWASPMAERRRSRASIQARCWPIAASTNCRTIPRSISPAMPLPPETHHKAPPQARTSRATNANPGAAPLESVTPFYSASGSHRAADGGDHAGGHRQLYAVAGFRAAAGGLSNDSSFDILPGSESRRGGHHGDRAARAAVRAIAGPQSDDLQQFRRNVGHCDGIQPEPEHRYRGRGSAVGHQRFAEFSARQSSRAADLQQDQSRGCSGDYFGGYLEGYSAIAGGRFGGYAAGAKNIAAYRRWAGDHQRRTKARGAHSSQSRGAFQLRPEPGRFAHGVDAGERQRGQRQLRWSPAGLSD